MDTLDIHIDKTKTTPSLVLKKGVITLAGKAIPTNSEIFCELFYHHLKEYASNPYDFTQVNVDLQFANGNSRKCLVRIFQLLDALKAQGYSVVVNWYHDSDDDMLELGLIYNSMYTLHFNYIRKKSQ
jgi:hypothetical protein